MPETISNLTNRINKIIDALYRTRKERDEWKNRAFDEKNRADNLRARVDELRQELYERNKILAGYEVLSSQVSGNLETTSDDEEYYKQLQEEYKRVLDINYKFNTDYQKLKNNYTDLQFRYDILKKESEGTMKFNDDLLEQNKQLYIKNNKLKEEIKAKNDTLSLHSEVIGDLGEMIIRNSPRRAARKLLKYLKISKK